MTDPTLREKIARIVDPFAFEKPPADDAATTTTWEAKRARAYAKAYAILKLPSATPPGFWLAPDEPTEEMCAWGDRELIGMRGTKEIYRAMRDASLKVLK